ncbi:MAG: carbohydrate-binding protein, partial [Acidobacteriota bacterium]
MSGSFLRAGVLAWILVGLGSVCQGQPSAIFPFQLPWDDRSATVTDLSFLNPKPAGEQGNVRVGADGHLYSGDRRIRFLGVNFTNQACFPQHTDAELIAGRLAKFGVNVVRFHLMDADWGTSSIFGPSGPGTRTLDAGALDRLDYFVARLKENGIYSDINLLTGRNFSSADGVDPAIDSMDWKAKQTPALFDPALIALQKEYASQLLGHLNPYTDLTYSRDPAVAFVEIVNEHGLLHAWQAGLIDDLPAYFAEELQAAWNGFLVERYGTQANLSDHWTQTTDPGPQMLQNPNFSAGLQGWTVEQHDPARA